jgi:hypothetical protein
MSLDDSLKMDQSVTFFDCNVHKINLFINEEISGSFYSHYAPLLINVNQRGARSRWRTVFDQITTKPSTLQVTADDGAIAEAASMTGIRLETCSSDGGDRFSAGGHFGGRPIRPCRPLDMASGMTSIYCPKYLNWTNLPRRKTMVTDGKMFHVRPQKGENKWTAMWMEAADDQVFHFFLLSERRYLAVGQRQLEAQMTQQLETECTRDFRPMQTALHAEHLIRSAPTVKKTGHLQAGASSASSHAQRKCLWCTLSESAEPLSFLLRKI